MQTVMVQASLRTRTVSPEHMPFAHISAGSSGNFNHRTILVQWKIDSTDSTKAFFSQCGSCWIRIASPIDIYYFAWKTCTQKDFILYLKSLEHHKISKCLNRWQQFVRSFEHRYLYLFFIQYWSRVRLQTRDSVLDNDSLQNNYC